MSGRRERTSPFSGLLVALALPVFVALRLAGVTHWSWWWVLSPLWIGAAVSVLAIGGLLLFFALLALCAWFQLRLRFRQSFPEVFIDPAHWSRVPADHADGH